MLCMGRFYDTMWAQGAASGVGWFQRFRIKVVWGLFLRRCRGDVECGAYSRVGGMG